MIQVFRHIRLGQGPRTKKIVEDGVVLCELNLPETVQELTNKVDMTPLKNNRDKYIGKEIEIIYDDQPKRMGRIKDIITVNFSDELYIEFYPDSNYPDTKEDFEYQEGIRIVEVTKVVDDKTLLYIDQIRCDGALICKYDPEIQSTDIEALRNINFINEPIEYYKDGKLTKYGTFTGIKTENINGKKRDIICTVDMETV